MTAAESMACDELVELVSDYLEGSLDEHTRRRVDEHLAECDGCSGYLQQFRATIETVGRRVTEDELEPAFRNRLMAAFRSWR